MWYHELVHHLQNIKSPFAIWLEIPAALSNILRHLTQASSSEQRVWHWVSNNSSPAIAAGHSIRLSGQQYSLALEHTFKGKKRCVRYSSLINNMRKLLIHNRECPSRTLVKIQILLNLFPYTESKNKFDISRPRHLDYKNKSRIMEGIPVQLFFCFSKRDWN